VQGSCALMAASLFIFALNVAAMLRHLVRPRVEPLVLQPALERSL
jgi:hypothetical protein